MRLGEVHYFAIGFLVSTALILIPFRFYAGKKADIRRQVVYRTIDNESEFYQPLSKYDDTLSAKLYDEVKILCMVMTHPKNHQTKAIHIKNTWGKRCNKLLFISSELDPDLDIALLPFNESRSILWDKTRQSFKYVYDNLLYEYDWFMKADDDK